MNAIEHALNIHLDVNEQQLRRALGIQGQQLSEEQRKLFGIFSNYCRSKAVRDIPAAPATIAHFLATQAPKDCIPYCQAILAAHDLIGLPDPTNTTAVRKVLESKLD